ncbi:threonine export protein [Gordonia araii NBRC 100433]|uniref:Threonine export protein n=1 Tax=Gordonia araii NBRC 100433 TaxID=1073574 RepID=G7GZF5_9ACTN|nr:threonine/serine exporter family protein [Gordonia araii]GAB08980.1 threonine export protein [Gordonia araii NBRC 100433]
MLGAIRRGWNRLLGTPPATIDTIEPGSIVIAPRKPIDLHDEAAITEVLDLAARIGALLLDAGTGAIDTAHQVEFVAAFYGLEDVDVDVTFNTVLICARRGSTLPPITSSRSVNYRSLDFTRLAQVDRLVRRIRRSAIAPATAHRIVDEITAAPHPYPRWIATLAWGLLALGIGIYLGGTWVVCLTAFATTVVIIVVNRQLNRIGTPPFFQQMAGGFLAVLPAALLYPVLEGSGLGFRPAQIIAAGIVVLLSGLTLVGAVQDAITGAPITGTARVTEVVVMTGGIMVGVALSIRFVGLFDVHLPTITTVAPFGAADIPARVFGGSLAAFAFALASYAERRALPAAFIAGAIGSGVTASLYLTDLGPIFAYAAAAIIIGFVGGIAARRSLTPPLVIAVAGITPLLPGLAIYRGMYGLMTDAGAAGTREMATAFGVGCALAAGVTLGEFIARTVRKPQLPQLPRALMRARRP